MSLTSGRHLQIPVGPLPINLSALRTRLDLTLRRRAQVRMESAWRSGLHAPFSIFVANLSTTGGKLEKPLRLTNDSWSNRPMAWNASSETLFYTSSRQALSIYKRGISSDAPELFAGGSESYTSASMSPDGAWLMATANQREPSTQRLLRVPLSGGPPETVLTPAGPAQVQCARTGSHICVLAEEIEKQLVFSTVDPFRGRLGELAKIDTNGVLTTWSLSPDGGRIALVENLSDSVRVLELPSQRIQVVRLTPPQKGLQMSAWSDDSKGLFLSSVPSSSGGFRLLAMDASGHTRILLENPSSWIDNPLPSPDGKRIAYVLEVSELNVTLLEHF